MQTIYLGGELRYTVQSKEYALGNNSLLTFKSYLEFFSVEERLTIYSNQGKALFQQTFPKGTIFCDCINTAMELQKSIKKKECLEIDADRRKIFSNEIFCRSFSNLDIFAGMLNYFSNVAKASSPKKQIDNQLELLSIVGKVPVKHIAYYSTFDHLNEKDTEAGIGYDCNSILDILNASLDYLISHNIPIRICANCGRIFIPKNRTDEIYCRNISPQYPNKDCREAARLIKQVATEKANRTRTLYKKIYDRLYQRQNKCINAALSKVYADNLNNFIALANEYKNRIQSHLSTEDEYWAWLNEYDKQTRIRKAKR